MYVLDTDVLSLTAPSGYGDAATDAWRRWVRDNESGLYLSVVTLMEVRYGLEKSRAKGATKKAEILTQWLASAEALHYGRIFSVSVEIAHKTGELLYRAVASGMAPSAEDAIIAATAEVNGFMVLTRNAKDMRALTTSWMNPFEALPSGVSAVGC